LLAFGSAAQRQGRRAQSWLQSRCLPLTSIAFSTSRLGRAGLQSERLDVQRRQRGVVMVVWSVNPAAGHVRLSTVTLTRPISRSGPMSHCSMATHRSYLRQAGLAVAISALSAGIPSIAAAQDVMTKESAAALKTSFAADIEAVHQKFLQLAQALPQDKYTWRPMEGVRSVSEALMLAALQ